MYRSNKSVYKNNNTTVNLYRYLFYDNDDDIYGEWMCQLGWDLYFISFLYIKWLLTVLWLYMSRVEINVYIKNAASHDVTIFTSYKSTRLHPIEIIKLKISMFENYIYLSFSCFLSINWGSYVFVCFIVVT